MHQWIRVLTIIMDIKLPDFGRLDAAAVFGRDGDLEHVSQNRWLQAGCVGINQEKKGIFG